MNKEKITAEKSKTRTQKLKEKSKEIEQEIRSHVIGYILGGLGIVAGLAWSDAIKAAISKYFPSDKGTIIAQFTYAFLVTVVVVIAGIHLTKLTKKKK